MHNITSLRATRHYIPYLHDANSKSCAWCVLLQGALGATAHHLYTQLTSRGTGEVRTPLQNLASNVTAEVQNRLYEGIAMYRQDLASIKGGAYKLPWDMTTLTHRQYNPLFMLNRWVDTPVVFSQPLVLCRQHTSEAMKHLVASHSLCAQPCSPASSQQQWIETVS
jgi:hypothetical protein